MEIKVFRDKIDKMIEQGKVREYIKLSLPYSFKSRFVFKNKDCENEFYNTCLDKTNKDYDEAIAYLKEITTNDEATLKQENWQPSIHNRLEGWPK